MLRLDKSKYEKHNNLSKDDLNESFFHLIRNSIMPKCRLCMDDHASTENSLFWLI